MMSVIRPYTVGSTVKWREGGTEYAGIIASVTVEPNVPGDDVRGGHSGAESFEPVYRIVLSDQSITARSHRHLVLV